MVYLINSHINATRIGWHLWEIDLRFAPGLPPEWLGVASMQEKEKSRGMKSYMKRLSITNFLAIQLTARFF